MSIQSRIQGKLPPPTNHPCRECPWLRTSAAGWLGPFTAEEWLAIVHSDEPIACHETITKSGSWDGARQCAGSAIFRTNVHKLPRDHAVVTSDEPDTELVFASNFEFLEHHES